MKPNHKTQLFVLLILFLLQITLYYAKQTNWDYNKGGADWKGNCKQGLQAPIDIGLPFFYKGNQKF